MFENTKATSRRDFHLLPADNFTKTIYHYAINGKGARPTTFQFIFQHQKFFAMKKMILSFLCLYNMQAANSQITKGNWLVGGDLTIGNKKQTGSISADAFTISTNPNIGYFVANKFAIGSKLGMEYSKLNAESMSSKAISYAIGPFARYYLLRNENRINLLTQASYQRQIYRHIDQNTTNATNTYTLSIGPVVYFNSSVGLEMTLNHRWFDFPNTRDKVKDFYLAFGFQIHLEKEKD